MQLIPLIKGKDIYIAVSGGIDSMVLLHLCRNLELSPTVLHCNFKLRGEDSNKDEAFIIESCKLHSIPVFTTSFETKKDAKLNGISIQESARNLRYEWFDTFLTKNNNSVLFTAHHLNDSIETFFINLFRGTSIKGLTGIPEHRQQIYRPLLKYSRSDIESYALKNNISYREDRSNTDIKYTRNKIRHHILPEIVKITPSISDKMNDLMNDLSDIDKFLETYTFQYKNDIFEEHGNYEKVKAEKLNETPRPILQKLLNQYQILRSQIDEILKLCNAHTGAIFKNDYFTFLKDRDYIIINKHKEVRFVNQFVNEIPKSYIVNDKTISFSFIYEWPEKFEPSIAYLDFDKINEPIEITNQFEGEKIQPLGMKGKQLVSDLLINRKLNKFEKEKQWILKHKKDIIWVAGIVIHHQFRIQKDTKNILRIEILE